MLEPKDVLKQYFGFDRFKGLQENIILSVLQGNDTLGLMPTGGGKSLCFQVPALAQEGICLVISPLVALMKDQIQNLQKRNIKALSIVGNLSTNDISDLLDNALYGNYKFLYIAPERLQQDWITDRISALNINLVAIDEAHCVSQWGHDFRPAYLEIKKLKSSLPKVPFLALTASATQRVQDDLIQQLNLTNVSVFKSSFERKNIAYKVIETQDKLYKTQQILLNNPNPAIIYVRNRKSCIEVSNYLNSLGIKSNYFHGGLTVAEKDKNMNLWLDQKVQVIVATNAFGMGIDKSNVSTIIHLQLPESLESYYQEAGRAGRDGAYAEAIIFVNQHDISSAEKQFLSVLPDKSFLTQVYIKLFNYFQIAYGELPEERFTFSFNHFCEKYNFPVLKTYNALNFLDRQSIISLSQEFSKKVALQFIIPSKEVLRYMSLNPNDEEIISTILRGYSGIFDMETQINTFVVAKKSGTTEQKVLSLLEKLHKLEIISYKAQNNDATIVFNEVREDERTINRISNYLKNQNELKTQMFQSVLNFASDNTTCKNVLLLKYFSEQNPPKCGICSVCASLSVSDNQLQEISLKIIELLKQKPCSSRALEQLLKTPEQQVIQALQMLLESEKIAINKENNYFLIK